MGEPNRGAPTPPIAFGDAASGISRRIEAPAVTLDDAVLARLRDACGEVVTDEGALVEAGRDWWPLAMTWALDGLVPGLAGAIARPRRAAEVAEVLRVCHEATVPVTAAAGRSGVCGASVPVHGGVVVDLCELAGLVDVDDTSLLIDVRAGTFGDVLENELREAYGSTLGHWPQSVQLSTVGGWLACRSAGQYSTRYGKIEDMVVGLEVALADGRLVRTGGAGPRAAVGPDLTQVFVGSEGTLGVITEARLRVHRAPDSEGRAAYGFRSFADGLDACRRTLRRGVTPAVLRLYDATESKRNFDVDGLHVLVVLDEGDGALVDATLAVVSEECTAARVLDAGLVERWLAHRNDVSALEGLTKAGIVVDTCEIAARWSALPAIYDAVLTALAGIDGLLVASAHQSHAYTDGACLYFTFAGRPPSEEKEAVYVAAWDAATKAVLANGGALSHHHGIGLNRARFVRDALGPAFDVLAAIKAALDPRGILNPGKLGLPDPFGPVAWP
jgi:alkyldihydroxyacetonephosphate synthase